MHSPFYDYANCLRRRDGELMAHAVSLDMAPTIRLSSSGAVSLYYYCQIVGIGYFVFRKS
jgi:hypothetical protein